MRSASLRDCFVAAVGCRRPYRPRLTNSKDTTARTDRVSTKSVQLAALCRPSAGPDPQPAVKAPSPRAISRLHLPIPFRETERYPMYDGSACPLASELWRSSLRKTGYGAQHSWRPVKIGEQVTTPGRALVFFGISFLFFQLGSAPAGPSGSSPQDWQDDLSTPVSLPPRARDVPTLSVVRDVQYAGSPRRFTVLSLTLQPSAPPAAPGEGSLLRFRGGRSERRSSFPACRI